MRRLLATVLLALPLVAQDSTDPTAAAGENISGSVELGYRGVSDVAGSLDTYRSIVNLNDGFRVFGVDLVVKDPKRKVFDQLTLFADNWGDPYNTIRVDAEREKTYRFTFDYRNILYFNALPSFANPGLNNGILQSQRTFDVNRKIWNSELEFRPGTRIVPYLGFSRDSGDGNGVTPFVTNGNEYAISTQYRDQTNDYRGGVRFEMNRWHLTVEQGGATFKDDQQAFTDDLNYGNRTSTILGRELFVDGARQAYGMRGNSMYSRALFTADPARWIGLTGQFLYSRPKVDSSYNQGAQGLLYLGGSSFADATQGAATGLAKRPHSSGSFTAEIRPTQRIRIQESILTDRSHVASSLLWNLAAQSDGDPATGTQQNFNDRLVTNYNRQQIDAFFDVTSRITLRGGHRYEWGDSQVRTPKLYPSGALETGELKRNVGLFGANFRVTKKAVINFDYEGADASKSYFRTSLHDYQQVRLRARLHPRDDLQFNAGVHYLTNDNPSSGDSYDFRDVRATGSVRWHPAGGKRLSVLGEYTYSSIKSDIGILLPPFYTPALSAYRDNAHQGVGLIDVILPGITSELTPRLSAGGSFFRSSGSRPTRYWQPMGRILLPVHRHVSGFVEWRYYGMTQTFYSFEGFRTHHVMVGLRLEL
jgi:hypothetical protein